MADITGYDPDKDYLDDPQQRDAFTFRCDWCGHDVYSGEHFSRVPAPLWARNVTGKDEITFCSDCLHEVIPYDPQVDMLIPSWLRSAS